MSKKFLQLFIITTLCASVGQTQSANAKVQAISPTPGASTFAGLNAHPCDNACSDAKMKWTGSTTCDPKVVKPGGYWALNSCSCYCEDGKP